MPLSGGVCKVSKTNWHNLDFPGLTMMGNGPRLKISRVRVPSKPQWITGAV